jgi:nucleotide-binding universal stress UspA family protein
MPGVDDESRGGDMKLRKILVPLDGSVLAESGLGQAMELARAGATLIVLRAAETPCVGVGDPVEAQVRVVRDAQAYLDAVAGRARRAGVANVETVVWYGAPGEAIVDAAHTRAIDLIVMSSHGRSGLGRLVFGSVAETVMRGTTTPILLIRPNGAPISPIRSTGARPAEVSHV